MNIGKFKKSVLIKSMLVLSLTPLITKAQTPTFLKTESDNIIPLDPNVIKGKLPNGFTYYIRRNLEPRNRVIMYLANKVGSILETDEERGLAHFTEHMSFNGTKHFPKEQLVEYLEKSGVRFGADLNAYTGYDETVYQLPLRSDDPEILRNGVQIMRDWAQDATMDSVKINKERGIIMEEKRLGLGPMERMKRKTFPVVVNNSRYAYRLPIGIDEVLINFKPETILKYYHDWYRPDLQALVVVGDIDVKQMEKAIKAKFSDLKNPTNEQPRITYNIPLTGKNQFIAVTDPEMTSVLAQVIIKQKAMYLKTESDYRAFLIRSFFNQMLNDRYQELSRQANPPFIKGGASIQGLLGGLDTYSLFVEPNSGRLEQGFKSVWEVTKQVQLFGFTSAELEREKQAYLSGIDAELKENNKTESESYVKEYVDNFLNQTAAPGIAAENELGKKIISSISLKDVNSLAAQYVKHTNRDIIIMAPEKDKSSLPDEAKVLSWIEAVDQKKQAQYKDTLSTLPLLSASPTPGKIIRKEKDDELGIETLMLSNGVKVLLKKTDFMNNEILFNAFSNGGTSLYSDIDFQNASAASMIPAFGVGNYNPGQLNKFLAGKLLSVTPDIATRTQGFSGSATTEDMETVLKLIYGYVTEPRKDDSLFKGMISKAKNGLNNRLNDPNKVFGDTIAAVLTNHSSRFAPQTVEKLDKINLNKAFEIYKERFANASGLTFIFVGSIDEEKIKPLLEKYLGSLPDQGKKEMAKDLHIRIPEGTITKTITKGTSEKATVYLVFSGPFDSGFENSVKMQAIKETLQMRMLQRLREQESGVYSPKVGMSTSKYPSQRFTLTISFGCSPANADHLIASAFDEVAKFKIDGPSPDNLNKFKAADTINHEIDLKKNNFWISYMSGQLIANEPMNQIDSYKEVMKNITVKSLKETADKYINLKNYIRFVLIPQNK